MMTINSLNLSRLDLIKIDVERMELEVLQGAKATIGRFRPIIIVEQLKASSRRSPRCWHHTAMNGSRSD